MSSLGRLILSVCDIHISRWGITLYGLSKYDCETIAWQLGLSTWEVEEYARRLSVEEMMMYSI